MKSLLFPKQILVRTMLGLILLALAQPGIAQDEEYVLLADSDSLSDEIHSELEQFLLEAPNDIERDQEQLAFITEEGQQIGFSSVFHKKRLRKSKEVAAIFVEYAPDYLILAWSDQKSATDSSYGVSKKGLTVHLRVLDGAGRNVHKGSVSLETKLGIAQPGLNELIVGAISEFDFLKLEDAIAKDTERKAKRGQRVKVVFKNLPQEDYFDKRDELIALIKAAGDVTKVRDKHDKSAEVLTVRAALKGDLDTFYRALYRSGLDLEGLDNFELDRKGNSFTFTALPASRKRLIIAGLSPEQYHHRLEIYRDSLSSIEGVKDVEFEFVRGAQDIDSKLIFTFSYRDDIHIVEEQVWKGLEGAGEAINRQLASISDTSIEYVAGIDVADLREVTLYVTQIDQDTYRSVDPPIQSTLESLGVRNLSGTYDSESAELIYRFEIGETTEFLTASIEGVIRSSPALENMVVESIRADEISFSFRKTIVTVAFNNIAPGDYREIGALLDTIIKQLEVEGLEKTYDPDGYRLSYTLETGVSPVQLDTILWERIRKEESLVPIVQDTTTGNALGYFYLQDRPATQHFSIVLKNLGPDAYRKAGRRFINTVKVISGIDRVRREYSEDDQVLRLLFTYSGESIYAIDDAIWETVRKDKVFSDLALGSISDVELVYVLGGEEGARPGVVIHMRGVSGVDYKNISTAFSKLLGRLDNVRDVKYHYLFKRRTIVFHLRYEGGDLFALDDAIQQAMAAHQLFQQIAKGPDTAGRMLYFFGNETAADVSDADTGVETQQQKSIAVNPAASGSLVDLVARLDPSVVWIGDGDGGHGSGFFVTSDGYVLTNHHVVEGASDLYVKTLDRDYLRVNIIKTDPELDLALLRVVNPQRTFESVTLGSSHQLAKGQQILNIGNPLEEELEHSVTPGHIAGLNRDDGLIQLSMPTFGGQSGSPVFNMAGHVIGVVVSGQVLAHETKLVTVETQSGEAQLTGTAKITEKDALIKLPSITIGFAIPIDHARNLLQLTGQ
jgi:S1-C subfamily serine protease